jgi:hypothetical protein
MSSNKSYTKPKQEKKSVSILDSLIQTDVSVENNKKKHTIYTVDGNTLVLVHIKKSLWGLCTISKDGKVVQGQCLKGKMYPNGSWFDGVHYHWMYHDIKSHDVICGKSMAPYFTAVQPVEKILSWSHSDSLGPNSKPTNHTKNYQKMGTTTQEMYDLSSMVWERIAPPEGYPNKL